MTAYACGLDPGSQPRGRSIVGMSKVLIAGTVVLSIASLGALLVTAQDAKPAQPAGAAPQLPPGMTQEMFDRMMADMTTAGQPSAMHAWLAKGVGEWTGPSKSWFAPETKPAEMQVTMVTRSVLGGRFFETTFAGSCPEMGDFEGHGTMGYDNTAGTFQAGWADNMGTAMMTGTGSLSSDGKSLTVNYSYTCPARKKVTRIREVLTYPTPTTMHMQMFGEDIMTGKEYLLMESKLERKPQQVAAPGR